MRLDPYFISISFWFRCSYFYIFIIANVMNYRSYRYLFCTYMPVLYIEQTVFRMDYGFFNLGILTF